MTNPTLTPQSGSRPQQCRPRIRGNLVDRTACDQRHRFQHPGRRYRHAGHHVDADRRELRLSVKTARDLNTGLRCTGPRFRVLAPVLTDAARASESHPSREFPDATALPPPR